MLMPSIFSRDFMDDLFDMPQRTYAKSYSANGLMKTDIKESRGRIYGRDGSAGLLQRRYQCRAE